MTVTINSQHMRLRLRKILYKEGAISELILLCVEVVKTSLTLLNPAYFGPFKTNGGGGGGADPPLAFSFYLELLEGVTCLKIRAGNLCTREYSRLFVARF